MKKTNTLLTLALVMLCGFSAYSQRYLTEMFDDVTVTENVKYGENITLITLPVTGAASLQELMMDVYEPTGDTETERPLVILLHTGNFLPRIVNGGIQGTKSDSSAVEISTRLAKMGYVVASADYRNGWNPQAPTQPQRALGLIQAAYRGMQDGRTCIRFFKDNQGSTADFGIDTEKIAVWGNGTGGYIALAMATLNEANEITNTIMPENKFFFDADGDGVVETPMVIPTLFHGDIEGKVDVMAADNALTTAFGYVAGQPSSVGNFPDESSDFQLALNVGGALGDVAWLNAGEVPIISYHHFDDEFAPYQSGVLKVPGTDDLIVEVQGSKIIAETQNTLGNNDVFVNANIDDVWTTAAKDNSTKAGHDYMEALYPVVNPANVLGTVEGVVIDWWDENAIPPDPSNPGGLPWNMLPNLLADADGNVTFHQSGIASNIGMSPEKAKTNIDTLIGFFAPRAYAALDLTTVGTDNISAQEVAMEIAPNPTSSIFNLTSSVDAPIQQVRIFDLNGRMVRMYDAVNENKLTVDRSELSSGMHIVMVTFEQGVVSKKVMFN